MSCMHCHRRILEIKLHERLYLFMLAPWSGMPQFSCIMWCCSPRQSATWQSSAPGAYVTPPVLHVAMYVLQGETERWRPKGAGH